MTAATKLKSIILDAAQVRGVQEHGRLVRFVVMKRQGCMQPEACGQNVGAEPEWHWLHCPFSEGMIVWVKERWRYDRYSWAFIYRADYDESDAKLMKWMRSSQMRQLASRFTLELASVEPVEHDGKWCWKEDWTQVSETKGGDALCPVKMNT